MIKKPKSTIKSTKNISSHKSKSQKIPYHYKPENLTYEEWQIGLRRQFAIEQHYTLKNIGDHPVYSDFEVSGGKKTYKVALRSEVAGSNFCSCPDFTVNTLGTCKHIEYVIHHLKKKKGVVKMFKETYIQPYSSVFLAYGKERKVIFKIGIHNVEALKKLAKIFFKEESQNQAAHLVKTVHKEGRFVLGDEAFDYFEDFVAKALKLDPGLRCYKDALDYIVEVRDARKRKELIGRKYPEGKDSPELLSLVKTDLHPYQKEAVLFATKAGRCIIADEMGLGKTLEAIASAELMVREFGLEKVLIICPTSLKYQWKAEIEKFSGRSALVVEGISVQRRQQYFRPEFFKIITCDTVRNDVEIIQEMAPDLVILDEAQRIKNWKTKTAQTIKQVKSQYAIVLTGTPLENRLEELHSITEFIDRFRLGPLFRFLADHQIVNANGKIIGYKELHKVAETIAPILIRRTKKEVMQELPARTDKNCYVPTTREQREIHEEHQTAVSRLVNKWKRYKFLSEKERQILLIHLNCMRMVSDSTFVLDQKTRHDTKIGELMVLLNEIFETEGKKVVIFSQWERMTRLIAQELDSKKIGYEYLHGGIPSQKRKDLLTNFHKNPESKVFLSTDAGSVGLNLQCASFLVNMDCPWNPAVLEQRIARIHRFGQKEPINVVNFISTGTIEEMIQETIKFKKSVFEGVLDNGADEVFMGENKFQQFMKGIEKFADQSGDGQNTATGNGVPQTQTSQEIDVATQITQDMSGNEQEKDTPPVYSTPDRGTSPASENREQERAKAEAEAFNNPSLQDLFTVGLNFLEQLTKNLNSQAAQKNGDLDNAVTDLNIQDKSTQENMQIPGKNVFSPFIEKDQKTGKSSLKIPMPDEAVLQKTVRLLGELVNVLQSKK